MSLEFNTENRNATFVAPVRRCCSFCKNAGHNISTCNDSRLLEFHNLCLTRERNLSPTAFKAWLEAYSVQQPDFVKAYAARYCFCSIRQFMITRIDNIIIRIRQLNDNTEALRRSSQIEQSQPIHRPDQIERNLYQLLVSIYNIEPIDEISATAIIDEYFRRYNNGYIRRFNIETKVVECTRDNVCDCGICYDTKEIHNFIKLNCGHEFCKDCMKQSLINIRTEYPQCAFCRCEIKNMELSSQDIVNELKDVL